MIVFAITAISLIKTSYKTQYARKKLSEGYEERNKERGKEKRFWFFCLTVSKQKKPSSSLCCSIWQ
jgi:hypothetical protein